MRPILFALLILIGFACKKQKQTEACGCNSAKTDAVENLPGIVVETDDGFEILSDEKGLLLPCAEIPIELRKEGQPVTVSGTLKTPCKKIPHDFPITPITISSLKERATAYDKTDITFAILKTEDYYPTAHGFGYFIEDVRPGHHFRLKQPHKPAVPGLNGFCTQDQATICGMSVIYIMRTEEGLPAMSVEILDYLNIINRCDD
jgi:hypothetical protein